MEAGRNIHDHRNSVDSPRPSEKNLRRRRKAIEEGTVKIRTMPIEEKLVAHSICVWCSHEDPNGRTFVKCPRCHCCQYCGLVSKDPNHCFICGNFATEDMIVVQSTRHTPHFKGPGRDHIADRPRMHDGPHRRDRRPGTRRSG